MAIRYYVPDDRKEAMPAAENKRAGVKPENTPARKPKAPYLGGSTNEAQKPWIALKISRRTWYRRKVAG
jgi:hypothetical protein